MTFEEFFKKKRIDLDALQIAEPALFSEFKAHFEEMGEKSFDHTKKYWFNKLRRIYVMAPEIKTEKVKIDNPLAEQTITESLSEPTAPATKLGFTPKFRATAPPTEPSAENNSETPPTTPVPKLGFTPKFKASAPPKPIVESSAEKNIEAPTDPIAAPAPKLGFTPKFKASAPPKAIEPVEETPADIVPDMPAAPADDVAPKSTYKPRFNPKNIPKKED